MIGRLWCVALLCAPTFLSAQTAAELVAKNLEARGGIEKIKAIKTLRMTGKAQIGSFVAQVTRVAMSPTAQRVVRREHEHA